MNCQFIKVSLNNQLSDGYKGGEDMSWYVLHCKPGQEDEIIHSCKQHLSAYALESAFAFRCERLWRVDGIWKQVVKDIFPGYVFLQSSHPKELSAELKEYRGIVRVMEDKGYLISVYEEEENNLRDLCGEQHFLKMSYGYKDRNDGVSRITKGPLMDLEDRIIKIDWHRRFAQIEVSLARQKAVVWAGVDIAEERAV